jgi:ppGpp synthetase/RelA/SpoT-type nucleotidyltranferase
MDEPLEKNFVQQMRDALQKQLSEFETAKKKAEHDAGIVANDGARRWRELKDSLKRLVEEINEGLPEGMLSYSENANGNEFSLKHELNDRTIQITFEPASAVVHSVKWRIKDETHLRAKLIRKWREAKKEHRAFRITTHNLFQKVNDLVGFRVPHLYTHEMEKLNSTLVRSLSEGYKLVEGASARTWDDESRQYFEGIGITTEPSDTMYTSVHYVFETRSVTKFTCEVQVRTLAEELWGEVDHNMNYPTPVGIVACSEQIKVLARLTSACTRLVDSIYKSMEAAPSRDATAPRTSATPRSRRLRR